jgi:hypothetical protein
MSKQRSAIRSRADARSSNELYWAPLPRPQFGALQTAGIVGRHLIPLIGMFWLGWSTAQFLILSVFNIGFSVASIGMLGVAVSTRIEVGPSPNMADEIGKWLSSFLIAIVAALFFTLMFGWVIVVLAHPAFNVSLLLGALSMVIAAAPAMFDQYRTDVAAGLSEQQRKQRDQPNILVLVLCAGLIFMMSGYAADFGAYAKVALVAGVTALFIFRDLRPDLMRELARPKNMPPA